MRNRWASRTEAPAGSGTVYWHILMSRYPEARAAAADAQVKLGAFPGLHLTPPEWLHTTLHMAGSTENLHDSDLSHIIDQVEQELQTFAPIQVSVGKVLYHAEAIMLAVEPRDELQRLHETISRASAMEGRAPSTDESCWFPHITVAYSTASQLASPIISDLGMSVDARTFSITSASLVTQWGPERAWDWEPLAEIPLGSTLANTAHTEFPTSNGKADGGHGS